MLVPNRGWKLVRRGYLKDDLVRKRQSGVRKIIRIDACFAPQHDEPGHHEDRPLTLICEARLVTEGKILANDAADLFLSRRECVGLSPGEQRLSWHRSRDLLKRAR